MASFTVGEAISAIGMGKFQLKLIAYAGVGAVGEAMELMLLSYVGLAAQHDLKLSVTEQNLISILTYVAMLFGAFSWGIVADTYGRRKAILGLSVLTSFTGVASAFSQNQIQLLISRAFIGFGIGGAQVYTTWYMEFVPRADRGSRMIWFFAFGAIGTFLEALLAWTLMEVVVPEDSWRWLIGGTALPSFVALLLFYYSVLESPRFLCSQGRLEEAVMVLERGAAGNGKNLPKGLLVSARMIEESEGTSVIEEVMRNQTKVREPAQTNESAEADEEVMPNQYEVTENEATDNDDSTDEDYEDSDTEIKLEPDVGHDAPGMDIDDDDGSTLEGPATEEVINENVNDDSTVTRDEDSDSEIKVEPHPGHPAATEEVINENANDDSKMTRDEDSDSEINAEPHPGHPAATEEVINENANDDSAVTRDEDSDSEIKEEAAVHAPGMDIEDGSTLEYPLLGNKTNGDSKGKLAICTLVSAEWWRITVLIWLLYFANSYSYSSLISLLSSSFTESPIWQYGAHKKKPSYYKDTLITSFAEVPGLLLAYLTLDWIGRRHTMAIMSCGGIIVILAQIYNWDDMVRKSLVFCARMLTSASFVTLQIFAEEVYPTHLRATGVGLATIAGWIGGMVWPALGDKLGGGHKILPMILYAFKFIMSGVCALLLPTETLGRELEDNDDSE